MFIYKSFLHVINRALYCMLVHFSTSVRCSVYTDFVDDTDRGHACLGATMQCTLFSCSVTCMQKENGDL